MRIALYHDLPAGGALRFAREMTRRSARRHTYVMFVADGEAVDAELAAAVSDVRHVEVPRALAVLPARAAHLARTLAGQRAIARAIDHGSFDVALFHPSQTTQAPHALSQVERTPTLYFAQEPRRRTYERGYQPWLEPDAPVRRLAVRSARRVTEPCFARLDREAAARASVIAANSSFSVESIARAYGRHAHLCHLGVDLDTFPLATSPGPAMLLSVGALDPTKGHDLLVEALGLLPAPVRPPLTVVHERADPRFADSLARRATGLGVELRVRAHVSDRELADLYASASATVAAARLEPFGLTPLESMAVGTPVLAVREGGYRETVIDGTNGILVDRNPAALAAGIEKVLELAALSDPAA
ncbi:MAG: hypothetical protein QOJ67_4244, partial [Acidimicrobiaceae bacterium]